MKKQGLRKVLSIGFAILLSAAIALSFFFYQKIDTFGLHHTYQNGAGQSLVIHLKTGGSGSSLLKTLQNEGVFTEALIGKLWLKLHPQFSAVKTGYYEFSPGASVEDIFKDIANGRVKQFSITLIEGLTLKQWLNALEDNKALSYDIADTSLLYEKIVALSEAESVPAGTGASAENNAKINAAVIAGTDISTGFCANQYQSLEGCLLANTYFFDYGTKATQIIRRAYHSMQDVIVEEWLGRHLDTAYKSPYEMLIMASIIEKETAVESERGLISGVFDNRLKLNMRLQTDPTVIYGVGDSFDGNLTRKHLRQKTPYNTYVIKGLPITPIAMAGPASIQAAAKPEITDAIYFVARGDGTHQFSETLAQHNAAVRLYQLKKGK